MSIWSLLFAFVVPALRAPETRPKLPIFEREPWMAETELDARPVIWSLENRPQDWVAESHLRTADGVPYTIKHKPSNHVFWTANGLGHYGLYGLQNCSCQNLENKFPDRQQQDFHRALFNSAVIANARAEQQRRLIETRKQFAAHFIN